MADRNVDTVDFELKVSISLSNALAERMRTRLFQELRKIEGDDPEVLALEHDIAGLWARAIDRQLNPFDEVYDVSGEDLWDDYRWFADVSR
jgi:hypothetical protein